MEISMNIEYLLKNKITANEFLILQMLLENQETRLAAYKKVVGNSHYFACLISLINMNFLEVTGNGLEITTECMRTFKGKGFFEEFYIAYPVSVVRPDGKRESLRTDRTRCATKYNRLAKRKDVHEHIMKCLNFEVEERTQSGSLMYMKKMPNWLSSEAWKEYEEKMKIDSIIDNLKTKLDDGTKLL